MYTACKTSKSVPGRQPSLAQPITRNKLTLLPLQNEWVGTVLRARASQLTQSQFWTFQNVILLRHTFIQFLRYSVITLCVCCGSSLSFSPPPKIYFCNADWRDREHLGELLQHVFLEARCFSEACSWRVAPELTAGSSGGEVMCRKGGFSYHARCVNCESMEQATTSALIARNSSTRSLNAMISVGQTNVLQGAMRGGSFRDKHGNKTLG